MQALPCMFDRLGSDDDDEDSEDEDEDDVNGDDDEDDDNALHARSAWMQAPLRELTSECHIYQIPIFF